MFLSIIPIIYLIYMVTKYTVDLPSWDEWYFIPLFEKMFTHSLTFQDLWSQHNEQRLIFPRIIMLAIAQFTGWNLKYETALNASLGIGIFLALASFLRREAKKFQKYSIYWILPTLSFLVFSLNQYENWLWGWQMLVFLNVFFVIIGFIILTSISVNWISIFTATIFGVIATYSFATGLIYWPIGFLLLLLHPKMIKGVKIKFIIFWFSVTSLVFLSYFYKYSRPLYNPPTPLTLAFQYPVAYIEFILEYLGSPLEIINRNRAIVFGLAGIIVFAYLLLKFIKSKQIKTTVFLTPFAFSLYAISSAIVTGAGRIRLGLAQLPTSRFVTIAELFWVSIVVFLYFYLNLSKRHQVKKLIFQRFKIFTVPIIILITFLAINSSMQGSKTEIERSSFLLNIRNDLLSEKPSKDRILLWAEIYPYSNEKNLTNVINLSELVKRVNILSKYNLSIFKGSEDH